tara:strand:- start:3278 stop:3547 length:270 start_codon:yes stop_codon:yes gene_type:complete
MNELPYELINKIKYYVLLSPFKDELKINKKIYFNIIEDNTESLSCYNYNKNIYTELMYSFYISDYEVNNSTNMDVYITYNRYKLYYLNF